MTRPVSWAAGLAALALWVGGCRTADPLDSVFAGKTAVYEAGGLHLDLEALADADGVTIWTGVPPAALVFEARDERLVAQYSLELNLRTDGDERLFAQQRTRDTLYAGSVGATRAMRAYLRQHRLPAPPGAYVVEAVVRDEVRGTVARQRVRVRIPDPATLALSSIRLDARLPGDTTRPLLSLHVPAGLDTLRAAVVCANVPPQTNARVTMRLLAFETDTLPAIEPHGYVGIGSLPYRGVRFEHPDPVQVSRQPLQGAAEAVEVVFGLPRLVPGLYRLDLDVTGLAGQTLERSRMLVVRPPDFPRVTTLAEMVDALGYLLTRNEQKAFARDTTVEARRARFDRFWARAAPNRDAAAVLMRRYYDRVEQANLQFSGFKPGWKTDRGMVYVVLGPPLHVETWPDREVWQYSYNEDDPSKTYVFHRQWATDAELPFPHYVLDRSHAYQRHWQRALDRWRDGRR